MKWAGGRRQTSAGKHSQVKVQEGEKEEYKSTGQVKVKYLQKYVDPRSYSTKNTQLERVSKTFFFKNEKDDDERLPDFSMSQRKCESIRGYPCLARLCRLLRQCKPALLQALPGRQSTCSLKQPANGTRRDISSTHLQNEESSTASIFQF